MSLFYKNKPMQKQKMMMHELLLELSAIWQVDKLYCLYRVTYASV